jgi:hypothetical protein
MPFGRTIVVAAVLALAACLHGPLEKYPDGGQLVCDQGQACGPGTVCLQGFCVLADGGVPGDAGAGDGWGYDAGVDAGQDGGSDGGADAGPCPAGCPSDQICADDGSKCLERFLSLHLEKPSAGAVVGPAGVAVESTLALGASAVQPPQTIDLLVDGAAAGTLGLVVQTGAAVLYSGSYTPPASVDDMRVLQSSFTPPVGAGLLSNLVKIAADTTPPLLQGLSVACDEAPCKRDGILTVEVTMTETHPGTIGVQTDLDGWVHTVPMTPGSVNGQWTAQVALKEWAFPHYEGQVVARVDAVDASGNRGGLSAASGVQLTRERKGTSVLSNPPSSVSDLSAPAVETSGTIVLIETVTVGASTSNTLLGLNPDMSVAFSIATGQAGSLAIGDGAIWIADGLGTISAFDLGGAASLGAPYASGSPWGIGHPQSRSRRRNASTSLPPAFRACTPSC